MTITEQRLIMAPKDAIMCLPTEAIEDLAHRLPRKDLLSHRRANPQLANRKFDASAAVYLSKITWSTKHETVEKEIRALLEQTRRSAKCSAKFSSWPNFVARVSKLQIRANICKHDRECKSKNRRVFTKLKISEKLVSVSPDLHRLKGSLPVAGPTKILSSGTVTLDHKSFSSRT